MMTILCDASLSLNTQKEQRMNERAKLYKQYFDLPVRFCSQCEKLQVFRCQHSTLSDSCIAKYEYDSGALNTSIGAKNILSLTLFYFFLTVYHFALLSVSVDLIDNEKVLASIESYQLLLYGYIVLLGMYNSFRELVSCIVSVLTGVTWLERKNLFKAAYFQSPTGIQNPFHKVNYYD